MATTTIDLFTKYNCTNCQDDIQGIRVHCAVCENFDLCLMCFSAGAEIGAHQNNHAYQFMDTGTAILSVFRGKGAWTAREEIRLLDAIEQYGFGNWEDISKHIETKSAEDAKEEYVNKFVNGTIGRHTWTPAQSQRPQLLDHTTEDTGPLGVTALQQLPPLDITSEEAAQLGYMPNRDSFEREYDPTAEQLISTISLSSDDTEADVMLKLAHVDMYTRRQRERARRKRLVRDYQLSANFFRNRNYALNPGMTREQKEFRDRFRVFAQFHTSNEYDRLLASLEREKQLRIRLSELSRYRYNGLTKIDDCRHFEQHAAMATQQSAGGPYGHGKTDQIQLTTGSQRQLGYFSQSPQHSHKKADQLSVVEASSSSIVQRSMHHIDDPTYYGASLLNKNYLDNCRGSSAPSTMTTQQLGVTTQIAQAQATTTTPPTMTLMTTTSMETVIMPAISTKLNSNQQHQLQPPPLHSYVKTTIATPQLQINDIAIASHQVVEKQQLQQQQQQQNLCNLMVEQQTEMSDILRAQLDELNHLPQPLGTHLLSNNEQQLCKLFNLPPTTYLSLKTILLCGQHVTTNLTPVEHSLRKHFIKFGWLSH